MWEAQLVLKHSSWQQQDLGEELLCRTWRCAGLQKRLLRHSGRTRAPAALLSHHPWTKTGNFLVLPREIRIWAAGNVSTLASGSSLFSTPRTDSVYLCGHQKCLSCGVWYFYMQENEGNYYFYLLFFVLIHKKRTTHNTHLCLNARVMAQYDSVVSRQRHT